MAKIHFREALPGVYTGTEYRTILRLPFNMAAIHSPEGLIVIDPLQPDEEGFRQLESFGTPTTVVLTGDTHERAAPIFRKRYNARVLAHADAIPRCVGSVDGTLTDGEILPCGITVIHLPGTVPGMVALWVDRPGGILIVGDAFLHDDFAERSRPARLILKLVFQARHREVTPFPPRWMSDLPVARESLRRLLNWNFEALLVGHGVPLLSGAREALRRNLPG